MFYLFDWKLVDLIVFCFFIGQNMHVRTFERVSEVLRARMLQACDTSASRKKMDKLWQSFGDMDFKNKLSIKLLILVNGKGTFCSAKTFHFRQNTSRLFLEKTYFKAKILCETFLSEHFVKYWLKGISWNTFTLLSKFRCLRFLSIKNCFYKEKISSDSENLTALKEMRNS